MFGINFDNKHNRDLVPFLPYIICKICQKNSCSSQYNVKPGAPVELDMITCIIYQITVGVVNNQYQIAESP